MSKQPSRSRQLAAKVIFAAMKILVEKGGEAAGRDVIAEIEKRIEKWSRLFEQLSPIYKWNPGGLITAQSSP